MTGTSGKSDSKPILGATQHHDGISEWSAAQYHHFGKTGWYQIALNGTIGPQKSFEIIQYYISVESGLNLIEGGQRRALSFKEKEKAIFQCIMVEIWRKRWDSNPRTGFPIAGFQDQFLKPLGHSSI